MHYDSALYSWPDDVIFRKDQPVTMQSDAVPNQCRVSRHRRDDLRRSDIGKIIEDVRDFENKHGRDHGNGWLLNHPLRKLLFYQHYLDTKARLAPAATTPTKKAKKAKTSLVGRKVHKNFIGEGGWFDGVVKSVKDGKCLIAWSDKTESTMKDTAVQKILV